MEALTVCDAVIVVGRVETLAVCDAVIVVVHMEALAVCDAVIVVVHMEALAVCDAVIVVVHMEALAVCDAVVVVRRIHIFGIGVAIAVRQIAGTHHIRETNNLKWSRVADGARIQRTRFYAHGIPVAIALGEHAIEHGNSRVVRMHLTKGLHLPVGALDLELQALVGRRAGDLKSGGLTDK